MHPAARVAAYTQAGWWTDETWDDLLRAQATARPDAVAVVDPLNRTALTDGEPQRWSWAELDGHVDRLAGALLTAGVRANDVVAVLLPNSVELVCSYLALHRIGAVTMPLPVAFREHELGLVGRLAEPRAVLTCTRIADRRPAAEIQGLRGGLPGLCAVLAWGDDVPEGVLPLGGPATPASAVQEDLLPAHLDSLERDPGKCVTVCWTSGTEALPKGVLRSCYDWIAIAKGSVDGASLTAEDVLLNPFPMVNMAGVGGMLVPWLLTGATLVQHHPFDLPTYLKQIAVERVTYTVAPPALLNVMLASEELLAAADLSSLRVIGSGSAPLSPWMVRGWKEQHGIDVTNLFGSNEGIALIGEPATIPDPDERASYFPRFGAVGLDWPNRAAAGMRTRLVDVQSGAEVTEAGQPGELHLSGPTLFARYLHDDGNAFDADGWFATGDVFELAADDAGELRYLRFVDRVKDMVIRGGMNISPAEIEGLVQSHPDVAEVAIVGVPDDLLGEHACAVVVATPGTEPTLESVVSHLRDQRIASYKLPEQLVVVDELPRNPLGKVLKRELRTQVSAVTA